MDVLVVSEVHNAGGVVEDAQLANENEAKLANVDDAELRGGWQWSRQRL